MAAASSEGDFAGFFMNTRTKKWRLYYHATPCQILVFPYCKLAAPGANGRRTIPSYAAAGDIFNPAMEWRAIGRNGAGFDRYTQLVLPACPPIEATLRPARGRTDHRSARCRLPRDKCPSGLLSLSARPCRGWRAGAGVLRECMWIRWPAPGDSLRH